MDNRFKKAVATLLLATMIMVNNGMNVLAVSVVSAGEYENGKGTCFSVAEPKGVGYYYESYYAERSASKYLMKDDNMTDDLDNPLSLTPQDKGDADDGEDIILDNADSDGSGDEVDKPDNSNDDGDDKNR